MKLFRSIDKIYIYQLTKFYSLSLSIMGHEQNCFMFWVLCASDPLSPFSAPIPYPTLMLLPLNHFIKLDLRLQYKIVPHNVISGTQQFLSYVLGSVNATVGHCCQRLQFIFKWNSMQNFTSSSKPVKISKMKWANRTGGI